MTEQQVRKKIAIVVITCLVLFSFTETKVIFTAYTSEISDDQKFKTLSNLNENWWWTTYELLTETSIGNSFEPDIAIDGDNNIHVVWSDSTNDLLGSGADTDIFYRKYDATLDSWGIVEHVSFESDSSSREPNIVIDSSGTAHVLWGDFTDYLGSGLDWDIFYKKRSPSGLWTLASVLTTDSTQTVADIDVTIDNNDNIHVVYQDATNLLSSGSDTDIFYFCYNKSHLSWSPYHLISSESTLNSVEPSIQVDISSGKIHIVWADLTDILSSGSDIDIFYRTFDFYTLDLGSTYLLSQESDSSSSEPIAKLDSQGILHVFWLDLSELLDSGSDIDLFYKYISLNDNELSDLELISSESTSNTYNPEFIIDKDDKIYLSWQDSTDIYGAGSDFDVFFKIKPSSMYTWSNLDIISSSSDDISGSPSLSVDSNGFVYCVWVDYSDILSSGTDADLFLSKFLGRPTTPFLNYILPKSSTLCNVTLEWDYSNYVDSYALYRSSSFISTITNLTPLAILNSRNYTDVLNETGIYFYAVTATNEYGVSDLSNIEYIEIIEEETSFNLFDLLRIVDIMLAVGVILLSQILISLVIHSILNRGKTKTKSKSKSTSKKK